jgi:tripartite-type tricarboxylate transporter receptor subunit TctC
MVFVFLLGILLSASLMAGGQGDGEFKYPTKTIELLAGAPGGDVDTFPRITSKYLEKLWGVPIIITNNERAVSIGNRIHGAPPDGYTVLGYQDNLLVSMANGALEFTLDDLTIVAQYAETDGQVFAVRADSGWKTLNDFKRACDARPDTLTLGIQFAGTTRVMAGMLQDAGIKVRLVDSGGAERVQMMEGGHIDSLINAWQSCEPYVAAGKWNVLAIFNEERTETCPQVPTAKEQGFNVAYPGKHVIYMPKGVDQRIVDEWNKALVTINKDPAYRKEMYDISKGYPSYANAVEARKTLDAKLPILKEYLSKK